MPITCKLRETVWTHAQDDTRFHEAMLTEAINELLAGDLNAGKAMLRDYVNATFTFDGLAEKPAHPVKVCSARAERQPHQSLFGIIKALQICEYIRLAVKLTKRAA